MHRSAPTSVCFLALLVTKAAFAQSVHLSPEALAIAKERLRAHRLHAAAVAIDARDDRLRAIVEFEDESFALDLPRRSVRSDDYRLALRTGDRVIERIPPRSSAYRGEAFAERQGDVAWRAAVTYFRGSLRGVLHSERGEFRVIQPASDVIPGADPALHLTLRDRDVPPHDGVCRTLTTALLDAKKQGSGSQGPGWANATAAASFKLAEVAFEGDVSYYASKGNDTPTAQNDLDTLMNSITSIYEAEVGITYEVSHFLLQTDGSEQYGSTDSEVLLEQFRAYWNANQGAVTRDTVHLLTGKNLLGSTIGIAYVGVICNKPYGYGLSQTTFSFNLLDRVSLTAHELGHNWNADHCDGKADCGIMCAFINSCAGDYQLFGNSEEKQIEAFRNAVSCLTNSTPPVPAPVLATFEDDSLDGGLWNTEKGASLSTAAKGETSGKKAVLVDFDDKADKLISKAIDPTSLTDPELSFFLAYRGVESGESMAVEYRDAGGDWQPLLSIVADGTTRSSFEPFVADLPPAAIHEQLKLRFRPDADQKNDDWYLDDVAIREAVALPSAILDGGNAAATVVRANPDSTSSNVGFPVSNGGTGAAAAVYSAAEVVDRSWLSLAGAAGDVTLPAEVDVVSGTVDPTGVATGTVETARVRVTQTNGGADDYYESCVTLVKTIGYCFEPGEELTGTIAIADDTDIVYGYVLAGTTLSFRATTIAGGLKPTITIDTPAGSPIATLDFGKNDVGVTRSATIAATGIVRVTFSGRSSTIGGYGFLTSRTLPDSASVRTEKLAPATAGADVLASFDAMHGTTLNLTVAAIADGFGPFAATIVDPDGVTLNAALFTTELPDGGVLIRGLPLTVSGEYVVTISGFAGTEKVTLTIDPIAPAPGSGSIVIG